ncbi:MAG: hypothetical protein ACREMV_10575 [Gemmatimonadales bacterium]
MIIELNLFDKVRRHVFPVFEQLAQRMSALAASYRTRDLATIMDFMERGVELSREYRAKVRGSP